MEKARILIVEDEPIQAMEIESILKRLGHEVTSIVNTSQQVIEKAETEKPDIILMDISIKGEMDGVNTANLIRSKLNIPVILLADYLDAERFHRAKITKPFGYLLKPIRERDMKVAIEMELSTAKVEREKNQIHPSLQDEKEIRHRISQDTTDQKRSEEALKRSEGQYRSLIEKAPESIIVIKNSNIVYANPEALRIIEYTEKELYQVPFYSFIEQSQKEESIDRYEKRMDGVAETSIELRLVKKSGEPVWAKATAVDIVWEEEPANLYFLIDITERKHSEKILRESEEKYKAAFKTSPDAVNINRLDGLYVDINEGFTKMTGFTREDVIGRFSSEIDIWAIPEDREKLIAGLKQNGYFENLESTFRFKDGRCKVGLMSASIITLNSEPHILSITRDITERKQSETVLKASQHRLTTHQEMIPLGVIDFNNAFEIMSWNPAAEKIFGYTKEEAIGHNTFDLLVPEYEKPNVRKIHFLSKPESTENITNIKTKNGRIITCQWYNTPILDINGEQAGMTAVCQDITEKLKTEKEVKLLRIRLDNIFNSMPSVLIGVDRYRKITNWNHKATEITGISVNDAIGKVFSEVLPQYKGHVDEINEAISNKQSKFVKKIVRQVDDAVCYEDVTIYPLIANGLEGAVVRIDDVTERVRMERLMMQTEKMMSVGGLAAGMAHELNNPLGGMLQGVQNIQRRLSPDLESNLELARELGIDLNRLQSYMEQRGIHAFINGVQESGRKASQIISNMLQFSRKSESKMAPINLAELIEDAVELAGKDYDLKRKYDFRNIKIIKEFDSDLPLVLCTETEIEQVVLNLVSNAAWAMANERSDDPPQIILRITHEKQMVRIEIEDNGPGMDEVVRKRIFEPFFTTKPVGEGTGLGLSVSYMIITSNHEGTMEVETEPGKGAKFIICLPLDR